MINLKTILLHHPADSKLESTRYSAVDPTTISRTRAYLMASSVITKYTRVMPTKLHNGELETSFLDPLVIIAKKVLTGKMSAKADGSIIAEFSAMSQQYAVIAETLPTLGHKLALDAMGTLALEQSSLLKLAQVKELGKDGAADVKKAIKKLLTSTMDLSEMKDLAESIPGRNSSVSTSLSDADQATTAVEEANLVMNNLIRYNGSGRGAYLMPSQREKQVEKLVLVLWAIQALLSPSSLAQTSSEPKYLDSYALGAAFTAYLYYAIDNDRYDTLFPMRPGIRPTNMQMADAQSAASKAASHWASMAVSASVADAAVTIRMTRAMMDFSKGFIPTPTAEDDNAQVILKLAEERLNLIAVAPVMSQLNTIMERLKIVLDADVLLPSVAIESIIATYPTPPSQLILKTGEVASQFDLITRDWIDAATANHVFQRAKSLAMYVYEYVSGIRSQDAAFYSAFEDFNPNSMALPSDLFSDDLRAYSARTPVYVSAFAREFYPSSVPKYISYKQAKSLNPDFTPLNKGADNGLPTLWSLYPLLNSPISIATLRDRLQGFIKGERYVWDVKVDMPLRDDPAIHLATTPIPFCYTQYAESGNIENNAYAISRYMMMGFSSSSGLSSYFHEASALLLQGSRTATSVANALAGLCSIYQKTTNGYENIKITTPVIYGVPTHVFLKHQPQFSLIKSDILASPYMVMSSFDNLDQRNNGFIKISTKELTLRPLASEFVFVFHTNMPQPGELSMIPYSMSFSTHVLVPVLSSVFSLLWDRVGEDVRTNSGDVSSVTAIVDTMATLNVKDVDAVVKWLPNQAWTQISAMMPHLLFSHAASPASSISNLSIMEKFLFLTVRRMVPSSSDIQMVRTSYEDAYSIFEADDIDKLLTATPMTSGEPTPHLDVTISNPDAPSKPPVSAPPPTTGSKVTSPDPTDPTNPDHLLEAGSKVTATPVIPEVNPGNLEPGLSTINPSAGDKDLLAGNPPSEGAIPDEAPDDLKNKKKGKK